MRAAGTACSATSPRVIETLCDGHTAVTSAGHACFLGGRLNVTWREIDKEDIYDNAHGYLPQRLSPRSWKVCVCACMFNRLGLFSVDTRKQSSGLKCEHGTGSVHAAGNTHPLARPPSREESCAFTLTPAPIGGVKIRSTFPVTVVCPEGDPILSYMCQSFSWCHCCVCGLLLFAFWSCLQLSDARIHALCVVRSGGSSVPPAWLHSSVQI